MAFKWAVVGFPTIAVKCSKRVAALEAGFNEEQLNFIEFRRGWGKSGEGSVKLILLCRIELTNLNSRSSLERSKRTDLQTDEIWTAAMAAVLIKVKE